MNRLQSSDTEPCAKKISTIWDVLCAIALSAPSTFASVFPLERESLSADCPSLTFFNLEDLSMIKLYGHELSGNSYKAK